MPRLRYAAALRVLVIFGLVCLWIQIMLAASGGAQDRDAEELMNANETSEQVLAMVPAELRKFLTVRTRNNTGEGGEVRLSASNSTEVRASRNISDTLREIHRYNDAQSIINEDIFGPVQNDTVIIAIQVHTRLTYLRHLVVSLAQARGIEQVLLIFSHDYFDEEINYLVQSIDFCRVMQIFYPYSIQTHPNEFPGVDPNDCPRDAKFEDAVELKCNNAMWPDVYGHYREAKYTQTKHHWWWKANRIFNQLAATRDHTGLVVFLEEDHYVAEDFLHVLRLMRATADRACPQCHLLCLGTYLKTYSYHANNDKRKKQLTLGYLQKLRATQDERRKKASGTQTWGFQVYPHLYGYTQKVEITPWHSSKHNMGMVLNRTAWEWIVAESDQFCAYDDYNWDFSLLHLSANRRGRDKFKVMLCRGPRVFHIGECGIHHKKSDCSASLVISKVQKLLQSAKPSLYPGRLTAQLTSGGVKANKKLSKGNGGWGDVRDQELCTNMTRLGRERRKYYAGLDKT